MSANNAEWSETWSQELTRLGYEVSALRYEHWNTGGSFDMSVELPKVTSLDQDWPNTIIVAKSIGTILTMLACQDERVRPRSAIFMGLPLNLNGEDTGSGPLDLKAIIRGYIIPTTLFQNSHDRVGLHAKVRTFLEGSPNISLQPVGPDDNSHSYPLERYLDTVKGVLESL